MKLKNSCQEISTLFNFDFMKNAFFQEIKEKTHAEVHSDVIHRKIYSVDASIYEIEPLGIAIPKSVEDLIMLLKIAFKYQIPVIPRGAATGITGGCIGKGLIIDTSKYLNKILEINIQKGYAICEPGVIQDQLNAALSPHGYRLGPETSTGNRATLGGMVANNSAGAHSLLYGTMRDHIQEITLALIDGTSLKFQAIEENEWAQKALQKDLEGSIYRSVFSIRETYRQAIEEDFPKLPRRVSGYNLDELLKKDLNLSKIIAGSEGTLGIATSIKVGISKKLQHTGVAILFFDDVQEGMEKISQILEAKPIALEMIDDQIIQIGRHASFLRGKLNWLSGTPSMIFVAAFDGDSPSAVQEKLAYFEQKMADQNIGVLRKSILDPEEIKSIWELRKAGLGLLLSKKTYSRAIAFIEDLSIPPERLGAFMKEFLPYLKSIGKQAGIYGHVGSGCMHIRPFIDLRQQSELKLMEQIMHDVMKMVSAHGGALSGEHGDGLVRAWTTKTMFGEKIYSAFIQLKKAFDPTNQMNPGKIIPSQAFLDNLRLTPETKIQQIETFLDFNAEGGFSLAADLCNGNGMCRKQEGTMCPSFQASLDEYDTTRARAQTLRSIINDRLPLDSLTGEAVQDVLDLCLECKGCKTECPSRVDMAKMKSELLYQYQEKHGYSFRSRLFAHIGFFNKLGSRFPRFSNWLGNTFLSKKLLSFLGITSKRSLPQLTDKKFSEWFKLQFQPSSEKRVVLYNDTYNEFNEPHIGQAAVKVLRALGYEVIVPPWNCCGRPALSKGFLKQAQVSAQKVVDVLIPYAEQNIPIIGLEPSCILTIKDDFQSLKISNWDLVAKQCITFDEFVNTHIEDGKLPLSLKEERHHTLFHGHCHQKSLVGTKASISVLKAIPGFTVEEIPSGCCGMAGSFGYEKEHYDFSKKIGELKLLPAIRNAAESTLFIADGISCRTQIADGSHKKARHLAEILAAALKSN